MRAGSHTSPATTARSRLAFNCEIYAGPPLMFCPNEKCGATCRRAAYTTMAEELVGKYHLSCSQILSFCWRRNDLIYENYSEVFWYIVYLLVFTPSSPVLPSVRCRLASRAAAVRKLFTGRRPATRLGLMAQSCKKRRESEERAITPRCHTCSNISCRPIQVSQQRSHLVILQPSQFDMNPSTGICPVCSGPQCTG